MNDEPDHPFPLVAQGSQLPQSVPFDRYRWLLSHPTWNFVLQGFTYSRSYAEGLSTMGLLLHLAEEFRELLPPKARERNLRLIYSAALMFLDKLDRWEDYITLWERLRESTQFASYYSNASLPHHKRDIQSFVIEQGDTTASVHWLYSLSHRHAIIKRKLQRKLAGNSPRGELHARQSALSPEEVEERLAWLIAFRTTGVYDFKPPAGAKARRRRTPRRS